MQTTENYGLKKPESTDQYNIEDFNENMEIIDEAMNKCFQLGNEKREILASNLIAMGVEADVSESWERDICNGISGQIGLYQWQIYKYLKEQIPELK